MDSVNRIEKKRLELIQKNRKIHHLSSGNPNEFDINFPSEILQEAFGNFVKDPIYKPNTRGDFRAREAIANFYRIKAKSNETIWCKPENTILTSGTSESYFHLFKFLAQPGDEILLPRPSYPLFTEIARLAGINTQFYRLEEKSGWQIDLDDLERKISPRTKAIVLISPSNPTGAVLHEDTLRRVLDIAAKNKLTDGPLSGKSTPIISDEVFSEFIFEGKNFPSIAKINLEMEKQETMNEQLIFSLQGVSKTFALPGLKLGWFVVSGGSEQTVQNVLDQLERSADIFLSTSFIAQKMLPTILKDGQAFLKKFQQTVEENCNLASQILAEYPWVSFHKPEGGFYLFARIDIRKFGKEYSKSRTPMTDEDFVLYVMEKTGIFVHPGYFYDYEKGIHILISLLPKKTKLATYLRDIFSIKF